LPRAFAKVAIAFGGFIGKFLSWAGEQVLQLLQIIFEVLIPTAMPYVQKAAGAFKTIVKNPIGFIGNLVKAGIQGFRQFGSNFLSHLRKSLIEWLTGTLSGANIYIPQAFELKEIVKFVLSVLGLTWQNIRQKLVKATSETVVKVLEGTFDIVVILVKEGPAAAWEKIKEHLSNLKDMVMESIMNFVRDRVVQAAITKLVTSLNPAGAFIQAILAIYNTVMFFIERLKQIAQVAMAFIDSIAAIAGGAIGAAANKVEQTMGGLLTLVISFLARIAGLGKVSDAVKDIVNKVRAPIDKALDKVIEWIVNTAKKAGRFIAGAAQTGVPTDPRQRLRLGMQAAVAAVNAFAGRGLSAAVINPALTAVKLRYGFQVLEAQRRENKWWIRGVINPEDSQPIPETTDEEVQLLDDGTLSVDQRKALISGARAVVQNEDAIKNMFDLIKGSRLNRARAVQLLTRLKDQGFTESYKLTTREHVVAGYGRRFDMDYTGLFAESGSVKVGIVKRGTDPIGWGYVKAVASGLGGSNPVQSLALDFLVPPSIELAKVKGVGTKMFRLAAAHFSTSYQAVVGEWYTLLGYASTAAGRPAMSANLASYIRARQGGASPIDAAKTTFTYKRVKEIYGGAELEVIVRELHDINNPPPNEKIVEVLMKPK